MCHIIFVSGVFMDSNIQVVNNNSNLGINKRVQTDKLENEIAKSLDELRGEYDVHSHMLFQAGIPQYSGNFARDGVISGILMQNPSMLKDQLIFCAEKQGVKQDPRTGEEVGKIFHEFPGIIIENRSTEYSACDTTALFLIGHEAFQKMTGDDSLQTSQKGNIKKAVEYILRHINDDKFIEDPAFSLAEHFALRVTYWKDSEISERQNGEPLYPVVYTLAHVQNMRGLQSAKWLLEDQSLEDSIKRMELALMERLFDISSGHFYLAIDGKGPIKSVSSDNLHALFYLKPGTLKEEKLQSIIETSLSLETEAGFRTLSPASAVSVNEPFLIKSKKLS